MFSRRAKIFENIIKLNIKLKKQEQKNSALASFLYASFQIAHSSFIRV